MTQSIPEISPITSVAESRDALFAAPEVIQRDVGEAIEREETADNQHWFRLVTPDVDRHGTIIRPEGVKTDRFAKNPVFLWLHQTGGGGGTAPSPEVVIGSVVKWEQDETRFDILVEFDTSPLASECLRKVKAKLLRMVSLGFRPIPGKTSKREIAGKMHPVYDEVELMEASLVIVGSNPEALALSRAIEGAGTVDELKTVVRDWLKHSDSYLPQVKVEKRDVPAVGSADPSAFKNVAIAKKGKNPMKMAPEYRNMMRGALGHALEGAELHTGAMGHKGISDEHKSAHREMAGESLKRAAGIVRMIRADHGEPDGDEMGVMRSIPQTEDADIAAQWASVLTEARGLTVRTVGQVVKESLGIEDPETVEAKIEALKVRSERYEESRKQERSDAKARESAERERLIADLLTRGIITPALANKARGINPATGQADPSIEAWSVAKLERFAAEAGEPVVQITRTAPLVGDGGQPVGEIRQAAPVVKDLSEVPAEILELGKYAGLSEAAIRENYARQVAAIRR